jgi:hypothetical protein
VVAAEDGSVAPPPHCGVAPSGSTQALAGAALAECAAHQRGVDGKATPNRCLLRRSLANASVELTAVGPRRAAYASSLRVMYAPEQRLGCPRSHDIETGPSRAKGGRADEAGVSGIDHRTRRRSGFLGGTPAADVSHAPRVKGQLPLAGRPWSWRDYRGSGIADPEAASVSAARMHLRRWSLHSDVRVGREVGAER